LIFELFINLILIFFFSFLNKKGLAATGATDAGFYGQGIHFSFPIFFLFFHQRK